jgi:hypothetical protein
MTYDTAACLRWIGSRFAVVLLIATSFSPNALNAQQDDSSVQDSSRAPDAYVQPLLTQNRWDPSATPEEPNTPKVISLESGLPLRATLSPLHWGHLSLFSANLLGAYATNFTQQVGTNSGAGTGVQATFANALLVYSIDHRRSQFNLQYMPTVWAAAGHLHTDFTAHALDIQTSHALSRSWTLDLHNRFQYKPNQFFWTNSSFAPDFQNGTATSNPLLLTARNSLQENFELGLNHTMSGRDELRFSLNENLVRYSQGSYASATTPSILPTQQQLYSGASASWSRTLSARSSMSVQYMFQHGDYWNPQYGLQQATYSNPNTRASADFQNVQVGFTRKLQRTISVSVQAGPSWSSQGTKTFEGGVSLFKSFRRGGVAANVARSNSFTGLIGNSYNNRYDLSFQQQVHVRWDLQLTYSYVQQSFLNAKRANLATVYFMVGYRLTPTWSVYSSYYYLNPSYNFSGSTVGLLGRQQVMTAGIRWAWTPQHEKRR